MVVPTVVVVTVGATEELVPPVAEVYQFNEQPVELFALNVIDAAFLHNEMFELLAVGEIGTVLIVSFAL